MAHVKLVRDSPEVKGGKLEGMFPEEAIPDLRRRGWKIANNINDKKEETEKKPFIQPEPVKEQFGKTETEQVILNKPPVVQEESMSEQKAETPKIEPKVEEMKNDFRYMKR